MAATPTKQIEAIRMMCGIVDCDRTHKARQMCEYHYNIWYLKETERGGASLRARLGKDETPDVCSLDGCDKPHFSKGWCKPHWGRVHNTGEPGTVEIRGWGGDRSCTVDGCDRPYLARGCCSRHYYKLPDRKFKSAIKTSGRRWRKRNQAPTWPVDTEKVQARIDYFGGRCWICGGEDADQIDHVKPIAKGGLHTPANMRPAHALCNLEKGATWEGVEASG